MKRAIFAVLALTLAVSATGCCCFEKMFCCGPCGGGGCGGCGGGCSAYGHEGPCDGGCGGGCGGSGCSDCGLAGGSVTGPNYADGGGGYGPYGPEMAAGPMGPGGPGGPGMARRPHPAAGHPMVHQRRNAGGQYEFAAGPPTGGVTYPYYTNRGPRDFLARNPRSIGP